VFCPKTDMLGDSFYKAHAGIAVGRNVGKYPKSSH